MASDKQNFELTAADACKMIRVCRGSGVSELKFGGLYVKFGPTADLAPGEQVLDAQAAAEIVATQEKQAKRALLADEIALKEQRLAEAVINDPMLAEELFRQGELSDDGDEIEET